MGGWGAGGGVRMFLYLRGRGLCCLFLDFESVETSPLFLALQMLFVGKKKPKLNLKGQCPAI